MQPLGSPQHGAAYMPSAALHGPNTGPVRCASARSTRPPASPNMQVLRANRLSKGRSHRASMLMCLLFAAPSALFGSHAAVELLTVEPLWPLAR
jgi:hypothetical protein